MQQWLLFSCFQGRGMLQARDTLFHGVPGPKPAKCCAIALPAMQPMHGHTALSNVKAYIVGKCGTAAWHAPGTASSGHGQRHAWGKQGCHRTPHSVLFATRRLPGIGHKKPGPTFLVNGSRIDTPSSAPVLRNPCCAVRSVLDDGLSGHGRPAEETLLRLQPRLPIGGRRASQETLVSCIASRHGGHRGCTGLQQNGARTANVRRAPAHQPHTSAELTSNSVAVRAGSLQVLGLQIIYLCTSVGGIA